MQEPVNKEVDSSNAILRLNAAGNESTITAPDLSSKAAIFGCLIGKSTPTPIVDMMKTLPEQARERAFHAYLRFDLTKYLIGAMCAVLAVIAWKFL